MAKNFTILWDQNRNIQEAQKTLRQMNTRIPTPRHIIITHKSDKDLESSKTGVIHWIQGILNKIISRFPIETLEVRGNGLKHSSAKRKNSTKSPISSKIVLQKWGRNSQINKSWGNSFILDVLCKKFSRPAEERKGY